MSPPEIRNSQRKPEHPAKQPQKPPKRHTALSTYSHQANSQNTPDACQKQNISTNSPYSHPALFQTIKSGGDLSATPAFFEAK